MKIQEEEEEEAQKPTNPNPPPPPTVHSPPQPQPQPQPPSPDSSLSSDHTSHSHEFSSPQKNNKLPPKPSHPLPPLPPVVTKVGPPAQDGFVGGGEGGGGGEEEVEEGGGGRGRGDGDGGVGSGRRRLRPDLSILKRVRRDSLLKKVLLGFRICGFVSCLVSFSVMAADRDQGWALDSFYIYKEFRYCMAVNVIGFAYSGLQVYDLVYQLTTGKLKRQNQLRYYLDFSMDQMLTYLLLSASSSAAVRVDDWESNWGKDKFTQMARASVGLSFLAFVALALSSLISGYTLCTS